MQEPRGLRPQVELLEARAVPAVFALGSDSNLWLEAPGWQSKGRTWVDGNTLGDALGAWNAGKLVVFATPARSAARAGSPTLAPSCAPTRR